MFCVRSTRVLTETVGGIAARSRGSAAWMRLTVSITLAPGCLWMNRIMPRPLWTALPGGMVAPA